MALSAADPADRVEQLIVLTERLTELIAQDGDMRMIARAKRFNRVGYGSAAAVSLGALPPPAAPSR